MTLTALSTDSLASAINQSSTTLTTLSYNCIASIAQQALKDRDATFPTDPSYASATDASEIHFLGLNWTALSKEVYELGLLGGICKMTQVFWGMAVQLHNALNISSDMQRIFTIEKLLPGVTKFALSSALNSTKLEKEMVTQQARFHKMKIKYLVAKRNLPLTLASCQKVFQETYTTDSGYRTLCERSFKEIYTPYLKNDAYHSSLFGLSYIEKIFNLFPILDILSFNKEEEIRKLEQTGRISTQFSDVDFLQLTGSEMIDLFKERLKIPFTLALQNISNKYEQESRNHPVVIDDEAGFHYFCLINAKASSDKIYWEIRETVRPKRKKLFF